MGSFGKIALSRLSAFGFLSDFDCRISDFPQWLRLAIHPNLNHRTRSFELQPTARWLRFVKSRAVGLQASILCRLLGFSGASAFPICLHRETMPPFLPSAVPSATWSTG